MNNPTTRAGKEHRVNTERYFHVMGQGWYLLTREGVGGPYMERSQVKSAIQQLVDPEAAAAQKSEEEGLPRWEEFFLR